MDWPSILAIVPAYNEAANIGAVVRELQASRLGLDIVVVDDGSSDDTSLVAESLGCKVLRLPYNLGVGGAVQTGLLYARQRGYQVAVQIDGDGQHRADEIPTILKPVLDGQTDVAIGSRFLAKKGYRSSGLRRVGIYIFRAAIYLATRQAITDSTSGFRAFNRRSIAFLAEHYPCDYPEVEVVVSLRKNGFRIKECAVSMAERLAGRSSITPARSVYYMLKVLLAVLICFLRSPERPTDKL